PIINSTRHLLISAYLNAGPDVTSNNSEGLWSDRSGAMHLIYRTGDPAPGTAPGDKFANFRYIEFNHQGQIALAGVLADLGDVNEDSGNGGGIWVERGGSLQLVARDGNAAPGAPAGAVFGGVVGGEGGTPNLMFNGAGHVAFLARLR